MGVYFTQRGDFNTTEKWLNSLMDKNYLNIISRYGQMGVNALRAATPIDSGLAASSWDFVISSDGAITTLTWTNNDIEGGCNVAILIDRGHATKSGSWVPGKHFIDSTLDPIIKQLSDELWKEVTRV